MIHYIILSMLLCSSFLSANKYDELYHKANKLLKTEQYQDALELYESLTPQGPVTYYNTGIALYHLQQYAQALSVWEKSEQHASAKLLKKIQYNKNKAYKKLGLEYKEDWRSFFMMLQSYCSLLILQILFLVTWFGFFGTGYIRFTYNKRVRLFLLLISLLCGLLLAIKYWVYESQWAIVITPQTKMFAGPNKEFDTLAELKEGERVKVVQKEDSWYKIKYHKAYGWIESDTVNNSTV